MKTVFALCFLRKLVLENKLVYDVLYYLQNELAVNRGD